MEIRTTFNKKLSDLQDHLLGLASMVDKSLRHSVHALKSRSHIMAQEVIKQDQEINRQRYQLEEEAMLLLATQQPVLSRDLRLIAAVLHIAGELERMGDYAKGIARISGMMAGNPPPLAMVNLEKMAEKTGIMLNHALDAFLAGDAIRAQAVAQEDDEVDSLYNAIYRHLLDLMFADNSQVDLATLMLWAAHNVERLGDRVTNICERIIFVETGQIGESSNSPPTA
ncbi:MAG: phosphate signaling complex protein PhoU [Chloroflexota bacterium]